jgi:hypothetical protein
MVKGLVKPLATPLSTGVCRNFCRVLQNSPKHLNSTFMKVVHLDEGHNFYVQWHFKFGVKKLEKVIAWQNLLLAKTG